MEQLFNSVLGSADVVIEVAGLEPMVVSLAPGQGEEKPNALTAALRPAVALRLNGNVIARRAPYGEPSQGAPWGVVLVTAAALGAIGLAWAVLRGVTR